MSARPERRQRRRAGHWVTRRRHDDRHRRHRDRTCHRRRAGDAGPVQAVRRAVAHHRVLHLDLISPRRHHRGGRSLRYRRSRRTRPLRSHMVPVEIVLDPAGPVVGRKLAFNIVQLTWRRSPASAPSMLPQRPADTVLSGGRRDRRISTAIVKRRRRQHGPRHRHRAGRACSSDGRRCPARASDFLVLFQSAEGAAVTATPTHTERALLRRDGSLPGPRRSRCGSSGRASGPTSATASSLTACRPQPRPPRARRARRRPGGILSENRPEWAIADYACLAARCTDVADLPHPSRQSRSSTSSATRRGCDRRVSTRPSWTRSRPSAAASRRSARHRVRSEARGPAWSCRWRADAPGRRGTRRVSDLEADGAHGRARRSRDDHLHLRHDRRPQGRDAHPRQHHLERRGQPVDALPSNSPTGTSACRFLPALPHLRADGRATT